MWGEKQSQSLRVQQLRRGYQAEGRRPPVALYPPRRGVGGADTGPGNFPQTQAVAVGTSGGA